MDFIPDEAIQALAGHQFQSAGSTWLDEKMDPFWTGVAKRIPRSVSPNLISVIGGLCCALAAALTVVANRWRRAPLYFAGPALIFVYMTCDAVDGKHARNTKQSTPLGAVVDHGIDAFCAFTTGVAVTVTADPALEDPWLMLAYCMFHGAWFSAQWGELTWGSLDQRGITEGEFASMLVIALPGILGPNFRDHWIPTWVPLLGGRKILQPPTIFVALLCFCVSVSFVVRISAKVEGGMERLQATYPLIHLTLHTMAAMHLAFSPLQGHHPLLSFTVVGMNAALLMTKMRFMATFRVPWPLVHLEMVPFLVSVAIDAFGFALPVACWYLVVLTEMLLLWQMWQRLLQRICSSLQVPFLGEVPLKGE